MRWCWWHHMTQTWVTIAGQVSSEIFWEWAEEWILTEEKQKKNINTLFLLIHVCINIITAANFLLIFQNWGKKILLLTQGLEECQGLGLCSLGEVCYLSTPKHFVVYHQKYEETTEAAFQTFCTWNIDIHTKVQSLFWQQPISKILFRNNNKPHFDIRESFTTIALLKVTVRSTGSKMWSGDCFCSRAIFQSFSINHRICT